MPLPPALLSRLQKRGIVKSSHEEVIAESYDSEGKDKRFEENPSGAPGCPNKYNPYHVCVEYCYEHWGDGMPEIRLSDDYIRRKKRMLAKFPLPEPWIEVYDAGIQRHYYWNQDTDEVCWLSPRHPRAVIGEAAPRVSRDLINRIEKANRDDRHEPRDDRRRDRSREDERERDRERDKERDRGADKDRRKRRREMEDDGIDKSEWNDRDRLKNARERGLDPMDPAAYGDAPVGKWSSGLFAEQKTGVDTTASGPLFQQRPYPAPGAILRQQGKKNDDEEL